MAPLAYSPCVTHSVGAAFARYPSPVVEMANGGKADRSSSTSRGTKMDVDGQSKSSRRRREMGRRDQTRMNLGRTFTPWQKPRDPSTRSVSNTASLLINTNGRLLSVGSAWWATPLTLVQKAWVRFPVQCGPQCNRPLVSSQALT